MGNASADKLIEHILQDARDSAETILASAGRTCAQIFEDRDKQIGEDRSLQLKKRETQVREILDGAETRARLDGRKEILSAKRELLDQAFQETYRALCSLDVDSLTALYAAVLKKEAEAGDAVLPAEADREAVTRAVSTLETEYGILSGNAPVDRGFLLIGKGYEKDCSLKAILSEMRAREETKIAEMLFS